MLARHAWPKLARHGNHRCGLKNAERGGAVKSKVAWGYMVGRFRDMRLYKNETAKLFAWVSRLSHLQRCILRKDMEKQHKFADSTPKSHALPSLMFPKKECGSTVDVGVNPSG